CGTALVQQATFCPGCGSSLNSLLNRNPTGPDNANIHKAQPPAHDISLDQTMAIKPQTQAKVQTQVPTIPKPKPEFYPSTKTPPGANVTPSPSKKQVRNTSVPGNTSQVPPATTSNPPAGNNGFTIQPKAIIILAVVLAILIVVLVLLLIIYRPASQALHTINPGFARQVMYH